MTHCDLPAEALPLNAARTLAHRELLPAVRRGIRGVCPNCGEGKLFRAYLKPVECCAVCGEDFSHIRADDGPAWLTILIVGHIVVALVLAVESAGIWPAWLSMTVFPTLAAVMVLLLLPLAKGAFISAIWATEARESRSA